MISQISENIKKIRRAPESTADFFIHLSESLKSHISAVLQFL